MLVTAPSSLHSSPSAAESGGKPPPPSPPRQRERLGGWAHAIEATMHASRLRVMDVKNIGEKCSPCTTVNHVGLAVHMHKDGLTEPKDGTGLGPGHGLSLALGIWGLVKGAEKDHIRVLNDPAPVATRSEHAACWKGLPRRSPLDLPAVAYPGIGHTHGMPRGKPVGTEPKVRRRDGSRMTPEPELEALGAELLLGDDCPPAVHPRLPEDLLPVPAHRSQGRQPARRQMEEGLPGGPVPSAVPTPE
mmetsp:Transcript_3161/g.9158  ORF Transcript_3161/g.9158 Transcript_3161/m.9158 type:complete len:246 (-) Transcript_3161:269-1006(-)